MKSSILRNETVKGIDRLEESLIGRTRSLSRQVKEMLLSSTSETIQKQFYCFHDDGRTKAVSKLEFSHKDQFFRVRYLAKIIL